VLSCGLDCFHFLIGDGERWRSAGSRVRFFVFQSWSYAVLPGFPKQTMAPPLNTLHHEPVQTGNPLVVYMGRDFL
jgi:hypothetical protein